MTLLTFDRTTPMWGQDVTADVNDFLSQLFFRREGSFSAGFSGGFDSFFSASLGASINGTYGFSFGLDAALTLETGSISVSESITLNEYVSQKAETLNAKSFIDTAAWSQAAAKLQSTGTDLANSSFDADLVARVDLHAQLDASVSGGVEIEITPEIDFPDPIPDIPAITIDFDLGASGTLGYVDLAIGGFLPLVHVTGADASFEQTFQFGSIRAEIPAAVSLLTTTVIPDGNGLGNLRVGGVSDPFLAATLDGGAILAYVAGIPAEALSQSFHYDAGILYADIDYTVLQALLRAGLSIGQTLTFEPGEVTYVMTSSFGETQTGALGSKAEFSTPEGEGSFTVDATYSLSGILRNKVTLEGGINFFYKLIEGAFDVGADFDFEPVVSFGFALSDVVDIHLGPLVAGTLTPISGELATLFELSSELSLPAFQVTYTLTYENFYTGTEGDDTFTLTTRQVFVNAKGGNDNVTGNPLNNEILGGSGTDTLAGVDGNDTLNGGSDADVIRGGDGYDLASYEGAAGGVFADLLDISRNTGDAKGDNYGSVEGLIGSDFADKLWGDGGANSLAGGAGDDELRGRDGTDTLAGGLGADTLHGDGGDDVFYFGSASDGTDAIFGFAVGDDIALSATGFGLSVGYTFVEGATFITGKAPVALLAQSTLLYDHKGLLWWDADGSGNGAPIVLADLHGAQLRVADVLVI
jgi:Ca2+-binding RTX toxin-like protein